MSTDTIDSIIKKTKIFIQKNNKKEFSFLFYGGEPLLAPKSFYINFVAKVNNIILKELNNLSSINKKRVD